MKRQYRNKNSRLWQLRQRANERLQSELSAIEPALTEADIRRQLHELQVQRVELEMQNAELVQTRADLESSLARYTDLYDFAPVGYFTLDRKGVILEANLTGSCLLHALREELSGKDLKNFMTEESRPAFSAFLARVFASKAKEICELVLIDEADGERYIHIEAICDASNRSCRLAVLDISERKAAEGALQYSQDTLRHLVGHLEHVKEDERKRIAREIHDDLGQNLLALRFDISMLHDRTRHSHPRIHGKTEAALTHLDATMRAVRVAINNLRPSVLDLGLTAAIEWQVLEFQRRNTIEVDFVTQGVDVSIDETRAVALFRILQESLTNVVRHAQASRVSVGVHQDGEKVIMEIADNGIGIFPECRRKANSFGLLGISERASALGGELVVASDRGDGTKLTVTIPLKPAVGDIEPLPAQKSRTNDGSAAASLSGATFLSR